MNETSKPREGDEVSWRTHGTATHGTVQETLKADTRAAGRAARADEDHPQFLFRSDKSGRDAVRTPQALRKEPSKEDSTQQESQ